MIEHNQVIVDVCGDRFECDEEIADIIRLLNWHRCETYLSCQDNNGKVWIDFSIEGARRFARILMCNDVFVEEFDNSFATWLQQQDWQWKWFEDGMPTESDLDFVFNGEIEESISLRFPREHLEAFREALYEVLRVDSTEGWKTIEKDGKKVVVRVF